MIRFVIFALFLTFSCQSPSAQENQSQRDLVILPGAYQMDEYLPVLSGKRVGLVVNHTSEVQGTHLIDTLLSRNIQVTKLFTPEHGLRGDEDAGKKIESTIDLRTGLPIISLYGDNKKPTPEQIEDIDILVFDIQDVGARFYTYISTLTYCLEASAENNKPFLLLDRPNPNGHYVDGPVLKSGFESFVGMHHVPIVYGMTEGEYAKMLIGEGWINSPASANLTVIKNQNYDHNSMYDLPVKPSPNLPNLQSILLYPSLCLFEGTDVSIGRGTSKQFQVVGAPYFKKGNYSFTPTPGPGSQNPKNKGVECYGFDFSQTDPNTLWQQKSINLDYLIQFYQASNQDEYFNNFFDKLAGNSDLRQKIRDGLTAEEIKQSWQADLDEFKEIRKKYLMY